MIERYRPPLGPGIAERFAFARLVTDQEVAESEEVRARFGERFRSIVGKDAVLLLPTMPDIAPLLTESEENLNTYRNNAINLLCLSGLSGVPQISMPVASRMGAPLGLSIIGPAGSDLSLARLATRLATALA
jgi:amidase